MKGNFQERNDMIHVKISSGPVKPRNKMGFVKQYHKLFEDSHNAVRSTARK